MGWWSVERRWPTDVVWSRRGQSWRLVLGGGVEDVEVSRPQLRELGQAHVDLGEQVEVMVADLLELEAGGRGRGRR
ncbi:MAG: hypothetical protein R2699_17655 [Acidimicrobiales bacterium]